MSVSIDQIKQLRDATGVSMTACKTALEEANGDFDGAVDLLRKKGEAKAVDKSSRSTAQGAVFSKISVDKAAMVLLGCETDFVAISDDFIALGNLVADKVLNGEITDKNADVAEIKDAVLKLGENIQIGDLILIEGSVNGSYIHSNKKIGVLVALGGGNEEVARDIAMHIAATNPEVIDPNEVSEASVAREKAIWADQLAQEGKPSEIMEKIMMGKEKKFREDNALIKQQFVKDPEKTVEQLLSDAGATVKSFCRFTV